MLPQNGEADDLLEELRCEVNLLVYPFFALTTKHVSKKLKVEFRKVIKRNGDKLKILWKVSANPEYGYPGPFDKKVYRAIEQIVEEERLPISNPIQFSIYNLCQRVDISPGGSNYKKVKEALERLVATSITSKGTFYHKGRKKWVDKTFHLYDSVVYKGEELKDGEIAETNYLFLNDLYLESLNNHYVKPLDFHYYKRLNTNIGKRLYELLGVKFFGISNTNQSYIRYKYSTLCKLLPLTKQRYPSDVKRQLEPTHKELKQTNFLKKVRWEQIDGEERDWYIYYYPGTRAETEIEKFSSATMIEKESPSKLVYLTEGQQADIKGWIAELTRELKDTNNQNKGFYSKLASLIVQGGIPENTVRRCLDETRVEAQTRRKNSDKEPIKNRSAYFTHLLKHRLKEQGRDLKKLLKTC